MTVPVNCKCTVAMHSYSTSVKIYAIEAFKVYKRIPSLPSISHKQGRSIFTLTMRTVCKSLYSGVHVRPSQMPQIYSFSMNCLGKSSQPFNSAVDLLAPVLTFETTVCIQSSCNANYPSSIPPQNGCCIFTEALKQLQMHESKCTSISRLT